MEFEINIKIRCLLGILNEKETPKGLRRGETWEWKGQSLPLSNRKRKKCKSYTRKNKHSNRKEVFDLSLVDVIHNLCEFDPHPKAMCRANVS